MFRHIRVLALIPIVGALAACAQFGQTPAPTSVASGPTVIVVTATPAPATVVPPTAAPPTAAPPTAAPPTAAPPTAAPPTAAPPTPFIPQEPHGIEQRVEFAPGNVFARAEGAVVRGTRDRYILNARGGQTMSISINSLENNAVFSVFGPNGQALPGTEEGSDISNWTGPLPANGDYVVVVGPTRGNATYNIKFTITDPLPQAGVGAITGRLNYPSEYIPAQIIYAVRADDPTFFYTMQTNEGDSGYVMRGMQPGTYYVMSYLASEPNSTLRSAFTEYVRCGQQPECNNHSLVQVTVGAEQFVGGVDVIDWYGVEGAIPNPPQGQPQPRSV